MEPQEKPEGHSDEDPLKPEVPNPEIEQPVSKRYPMRKIILAATPQTKLFFVLGTISSWIIGIAIPVFFYLQTLIIDEMSEEEEDDYDFYEETMKVTYMYMVVAFFMFIGGYGAVFFFVRVGQNIGMDLRHQYFQAMVSKDIQFYDTNSKSQLEVPQHMNRSCEVVELGTGEKFLGFMEMVMYMVVAFGMSLQKSPQLFLVALSLLPLDLIATGIIGLSVIKGAVMREEAYKTAGGISEEALMEIKTVQAHNGQTYTSKRYDNELAASVTAVSKSGFIEGLGWGSLWASWFLMGVLVFWVAAKWVSDERRNWIWDDDIEGTDVVLVFWVMAYACNMVGNIIAGVVAVIDAEVGYCAAKDFIEIESKFVDGSLTNEIVGVIEFKDVKFAYPKAPRVDVLKSVSFAMEAKRSYAIVGESGAGKSTIIQLIERFYEPTEGLVLIDGHPVSRYSINDLRRQIGYVSQEPILFNLTIRENILLTKKDASDAEIEAALKHANAYDFIKSLEKKLDEVVGLKGARLSGGQKQRVAIARAIIKKPKILLLDEATSALDNLSEAVVLEALQEITRKFNMTTVSVAQKLSTIRHVDKIIVLENGYVTQQGNHEELMAQEGRYQRMCRTQGINFTSIIATKSVESVESLEQLNKVAPHEEKPIPEVTAFNLPIIRILKFSLSYLHILIIGLAGAIGAGVSFPIYGYFVGKMTYYFIDSAGDEMEDNIRKFALLTLLFVGLVLLFFFLMFWCFAMLTAYITRDLRSLSFYQLLHYDAEFFDKEENNSSTLAQNLSQDTEKLNSAGGPLIGISMVTIMAMAFNCGIALMWNWQLGLLMTAFAPIQMFGMVRGYSSQFSGLTHPPFQQAQQMGLDVMINLKTVKAYGMEQELVTKHQEITKKAYESTSSEGHWNAFFFGLALFIQIVAYSSYFWYAAYLQKHDDIGSEDILVAFYANLMASVGIFTAAIYVPAVGAGASAARRIFDIIDYVPKVNSQAEGRKDAVEGPIEFKDVSFKYAGRDNTVLDHISFKVLKNQTIGITGPSGSGKTSIVQLILRFYDPVSGNIFINGIDITTYDLKHLRTFIATVGQEPVLFRGSLRHNIGFGYKDEQNQDATDASILAAMEQAKVNFTRDLDYEIGARGQTISGGQKQRVSIARAILRNPTILLLDEATSALDSQTEQDVLNTLEEVGKERTVILIAHRLSTICKCDNILVMEEGKISQQGTHQELLDLGGEYADLWNSVNKD